MITAEINVNVTPLTDNTIWFANAAAWNTYWANITANVEIDAIDTDLYTPVNYLTGLQPYAFQLNDGPVTVLATNEMFASLLAKVNALDTAFQTMRTELATAGLITNAQ